ncbi:hypothetical protein LXA43DRAFT_228664 [Ganoderma leucocontextum]|nr:hypothetical protein LXA43DRAFT_228664 [Ganoderma leucocontextum]
MRKSRILQQGMSEGGMAEAQVSLQTELSFVSHLFPPLARAVCRSAQHTAVGKLRELDTIGYGSPMALTSALMEWNRFHQWALGTLVDAVIYLNGGIDAVMSSHPPRAQALLIYLKPTHSIEAGGNPADAFEVAEPSLVKMGEHPLLRDKASEDLRAQCKLLEQMMLVDGHFDDPTFVGILPGAYAITGTRNFSYQKFPVYRLPVRHVKDDPRDERTRAAVQSLADMLLAAMTTGVVFKRSENRVQEEPDIGRVVRVKKAWKWERRPADWDSFDAIVGRELAAGSGLTPRTLLTLFDHRCSGERLRTMQPI